ncbi:MAG: hypothetical protein XD94_0350, partial [Mesotoga prima]
MKRFIVCFLIAVLFYGCEKEITPNLSSEANMEVVINAMFTDETNENEVEIRWSIPQPNDIASPINDAQVILSSFDEVILFGLDSSKPGTYRAKTNLRLQQEYTLTVSIDEQIYSARAELASGKAFNPPTFSYSSEEKLYYLDKVANPFDPSDPAIYQLEADWSEVPGYTQLPKEQTHALFYFFSLQTLDVSQLLPPPSEKIGFPAGTIIDIKRFALSQEHAEY